MQNCKRKQLILIILIPFILLMSVLLPFKAPFPHSAQLLDMTSHIKASFTQSGQIINNTYNWYKITFGEGEKIQVNVTCIEEANYTVGVIISDKVQPNVDIASTMVLVGAILNATQNVSISYVTWDFFQKTFGIFLLIISLNDSNPLVINYTIDCSHPIMPYSYNQYYNQVFLPIFLTVVAIILGIAAAITMYLIKKWRSH